MKRGCNLPAFDSNGLSDPFVVLSLVNGGPKKPIGETLVKYKTLNPEFNQTFDKISLVDLNFTLHFDVFDKDTFGRDEMGYVTCDLSKVSRGQVEDFDGFLENGFKGGSLVYSILITDNRVIAQGGCNSPSVGDEHASMRATGTEGFVVVESNQAKNSGVPRYPSLLQPDATAPFRIDITIQSANNVDQGDPLVTISSVLFGEPRLLGKTHAKQRNR